MRALSLAFACLVVNTADVIAAEKVTCVVAIEALGLRPERVTQTEIAYQHALASTQRFSTFSPQRVQEARQEGGPTLHAGNKTELMVMLANFVAIYSPEEKDLIARLSSLLD